MDWIIGPTKVDDEIRRSLRILRLRARQASNDVPLVGQYLTLLVANVLGSEGPTLESLAVNALGGEDEPARAAVEAAWESFCESEVTVDGGMTFYEAAALALETMATDGEAFLRIFRGYPNRFGFALQFVDADQVDETLNRSRSAGVNEIRMGVEVDRLGRPVGYHVRELAGEDPLRPQVTTFVPAADMIHLFRRRRANQVRGITWFHRVLYQMRMMNGFVEASLIRERLSASAMGFLVRKEGTGGEISESEKDEDGNPIPKTIDVNPGTFEELDPGVEIQEWNPQGAPANYGEFMKNGERWLASGLSVNYNALANDFEGVNYSSMRSGLQIEREVWKMLQKIMTRGLFDRVFGVFVEMASLVDSIAIPNALPSRLRPAAWTPRGWDWVDPLKDAQATLLEISAGLNSRTRALREKGVEVEDVMKELKNEADLATQYGVKVDPGEASAAAAAGADSADANSSSKKSGGRGLSILPRQ